MALGLAAATVLATAVGGLLSWVAVRRSLGVIFTGIVTLAFSLPSPTAGQRELTGGETGWSPPPARAPSCRSEWPPTTCSWAVRWSSQVFRALERSHARWAFRAPASARARCRADRGRRGPIPRLRRPDRLRHAGDHRSRPPTATGSSAPRPRVRTRRRPRPGDARLGGLGPSSDPCWGQRVRGGGRAAGRRRPAANRALRPADHRALPGFPGRARSWPWRHFLRVLVQQARSSAGGRRVRAALARRRPNHPNEEG